MKNPEFLREQALRLLEEANKIEERYIEEPEGFDDVNMIFFRKTFRHYKHSYTYCAVRVPANNLWYVSGSRTFADGGTTWDDLLAWIQDGSSWEIWTVAEVRELGSDKK